MSSSLGTSAQKSRSAQTFKIPLAKRRRTLKVVQPTLALFLAQISPPIIFSTCLRRLISSHSSIRSPVKPTECITLKPLELVSQRLTILQVVELLKTTATAVKDNEPGTLRYQVHRETKGDAPMVVMLETWVPASTPFVFHHGALIRRESRVSGMVTDLTTP